MKKTLLLGVILALLLSAPASAGTNPFYSRIDALCNLPEISVTVPATSEIFINPYRLSIAVEADETSAQIITAPACIENKSQVPISVSVAATGTVNEGSNLRLVSTTTGGEGTKKQAFIYFEMKASDTSNPPVSFWDAEYNAEKHVIVRVGSGRIKKNIAVLSAVDGTERFGAFRLTGDCTATPYSGWTEDDGISVELTFTFTPLARPGI